MGRELVTPHKEWLLDILKRAETYENCWQPSKEELHEVFAVVKYVGGKLAKERRRYTITKNIRVTANDSPYKYANIVLPLEGQRHVRYALHDTPGLAAVSMHSKQDKNIENWDSHMRFIFKDDYEGLAVIQEFGPPVNFLDSADGYHYGPPHIDPQQYELLKKFVSEL